MSRRPRGTIAIACPSCRARAGEACEGPLGLFYVAPHAERKRLVSRFPAYAVGIDGTITRIRGGNAIRPQLRGGYLRVKLTGACGFRHWLPVHKIVLEAFVGPRPSPRHHGAHLDGDRTNNALANLEWKLPTENEADKRAHGTARNGRGKKLFPYQERDVLRRARRGWSYTRIAAAYAMHRHSIARIVRRLERHA